jgi:CheY-like chemotaxis protein
MTTPETSERILIVDDEKHLLLVLTAFIRRAGYEVVAAGSGD